MKKIVLFFMVLALLGTMGLTGVAWAQATVIKKLPPPPTATGKIDKFLNVLQNATTLEEVQNAFDGAGFSNAEVDQVKNRTEGSASLKQKLQRLQNEQWAAMSVLVDQYKRQAASRTAARSAQLNQQRIAEFKKMILSLKQSIPIAVNALQPAVRCKADAPSITSVSPVTPGVEFAVQGTGFDEYPGTVALTTEGKVFWANVTGWNSCTVYAELGDEVSGVLANTQASVSIKTDTGKITRGLTTFTPAFETGESTEADCTCGYYFGNHGDWNYWNYALKNDWYVVGTSLDHSDYGHAEITSAPVTNAPNGSALTKVHAGVAGVGCSCFSVKLSLAGPRGLRYK